MTAKRSLEEDVSAAASGGEDSEDGETDGNAGARVKLARCDDADSDAAAPHADDAGEATGPSGAMTPHRVKVYELRHGMWTDRGTGYCFCYIDPETSEAAISVKSENTSQGFLLHTHIHNPDIFTKQQETLIVWTDLDGVDMALSFQESEGCSEVIDFIGRLIHNGSDDLLSDDQNDPIVQSLTLPSPELKNFAEIESILRDAYETTSSRREKIIKLLMKNNMEYIAKLQTFLEPLEDLENLQDLHRLCNIMKCIVMLGDVSIIEWLINDENIFTAVGILEYDPEYPTLKANHRDYLSDKSKFQQVIEIPSPEIAAKIHQTFRLQYLKDVVLARILEDSTFSILNSLIYYNQVDIVGHLQADTAFVRDLFSIFKNTDADEIEKYKGINFIQQFSSIAKSLQVPARSQLYRTFVSQGLFDVIDYALKSPQVSMRLAGTEIMGAVVEHDPTLVRIEVLRQHSMTDPQPSCAASKPLIISLVTLICSEKNLGLKSQLVDILRVLLDPTVGPPIDANGKGVPQDSSVRLRFDDPDGEKFLQWFYDFGITSLTEPLTSLEADSPCISHPTAEQAALYSHISDLLYFMVRNHKYRAKYFILASKISTKIALFLQSKVKCLNLGALRFFRICLGVKDDFYNRHFIKFNIFESILKLALDSSSRYNLVCSACLDLFEYIRKEGIKTIIIHLGDNFQPQLTKLSFLSTFADLLSRYEQYQYGLEDTQSIDSHNTIVEKQTIANGEVRWSTHQEEPDAEEEEYFSTCDEEDVPRTASMSPTIDAQDAGNAEIDEEEYSILDKMPPFTGVKRRREEEEEEEIDGMTRLITKQHLPKSSGAHVRRTQSVSDLKIELTESKSPTVNTQGLEYAENLKK